jgi:TolA-binding protein
MAAAPNLSHPLAGRIKHPDDCLMYWRIDMYHGPDQHEIDEINAMPDHDPIAVRALERAKLSNAKRGFRTFVIFVGLYFGIGGLYQYVIAGVVMRPAITQYKRGHIKVAQAGLEKYLNLWGSDSDAHYYLGMCFYSERRDADAIRQFALDTSGLPVRNREVMSINKRSKAMIERIE